MSRWPRGWYSFSGNTISFAPRQASVFEHAYLFTPLPFALTLQIYSRNKPFLSMISSSFRNCLLNTEASLFLPSDPQEEEEEELGRKRRRRSRQSMKVGLMKKVGCVLLLLQQARSNTQYTQCTMWHVVIVEVASREGLTRTRPSYCTAASWKKCRGCVKRRTNVPTPVVRMLVNWEKYTQS